MEKENTKVSNIGRNDPCPCGSGKKYKLCCLEKDLQKEREALANAPAPVEEVDESESTANKAQKANQWRRPKSQKW